jgi:hypothetical protein
VDQARLLLTTLRRRGDGFTGALDGLTTDLAVAYSLRRLLSSYKGAAIRVREDSGNTEADIGFDSDGNLDTTALLAHTGANSGYVVKWYDQAGNSRDLAQATAVGQPRIVNSGSVDVDAGGLPQMFCNGDGFSVAWEPPSGNISCFCVFSPTVDTGTQVKLIVSGDDNSAFWIWDESSPSDLNINCGAPSHTLNGVLQTWADRPDVYESLVFGNRYLWEALSLDLSSWPAFQVLGYPTEITRAQGNLQEFVVYSSNVTPTPVRSAINDYWGIF